MLFFSPKVCQFCRGSSPCCHVKPDLKQKSVTLTANQSTDLQRRWLRGGRGEATVFCLFSLRLCQMSHVLCQRGRREAVCSVWRSSTDWLPLSSNDRWRIKKAKKKESKTEVNRKQHKSEWMNEWTSHVSATCVEAHKSFPHVWNLNTCIFYMWLKATPAVACLCVSGLNDVPIDILGVFLSYK